MKTTNKLATLFATSTLILAGASATAFAASTMTDAFVANARPNVEFLDSSSRLALSRSDNSRIRAFARSEARDQTITANSMTAWAETNTPVRAAVALGGIPARGPLAPVADVAVLPLSVAANVTTGVTDGVGDVLTGRSVSIDDPLAVVAPTAPVVEPVGLDLLPSEQKDMDRLKEADGRAFDTLYKSVQNDALHQLGTLYLDYSRNGDDPALRAIASQELPKINGRIAELRRL